MSRTPAIALSVSLVVLLASPTPAHAQDPEARAARMFEAGAEYFNTGRYEEAIKVFRDGYAIFPNPMFQYNISVAAIRLGRVTQALEAADKAATNELPAEVRPRNGARQMSLRTVLSGRDVATRINDLPPRDKGDDVALTPDPDPVPTEPSEPIDWPLWGGYAGVGLGTALLAGALVINFRLQDDIDELEGLDRDMMAERANRLERDIEDAQSTGQILLYAGLGVGAAGGALLWYALTRDATSDQRALWLTPTNDGAILGFRAPLP